MVDGLIERLLKLFLGIVPRLGRQQEGVGHGTHDNTNQDDKRRNQDHRIAEGKGMVVDHHWQGESQSKGNGSMNSTDCHQEAIAV